MEWRRQRKKGISSFTSKRLIDFESVKKILADGIIFPTENVAQDYAETVGKNYRLPTVTISFDPSAIFAKPMPSVVIENQKIINASIDYLIQKGT